MLLSHNYVEQIGDLAQYTGSIEGFNKLKGVLLRSQSLSQYNKSVLESIFMRKERGNESADQYGNALRSLAKVTPLNSSDLNNYAIINGITRDRLSHKDHSADISKAGVINAESE